MPTADDTTATSTRPPMLTAWLYWPGHAAARRNNGGESYVKFGDASMAVRLVDEADRLHMLLTDALAQLDAMKTLE